MGLTVLNVAYPLAPVGPDAVGGAEQVLTAIDAALVEAGHRSIGIACEGSQAAGRLWPVHAERGRLDGAAKHRAWARHRRAIGAALQRWAIDIVHLHGIDFHAYLPATAPTLVTLHLPLDWYPVKALCTQRPNLWLHGVSESQHREAPVGARLLPPVPNGVDVDLLSACHAKRRFALVMGRICPEKGIHLAIDAAEKAGCPLVIAGQVFGYDAHQRYFDNSIAPRLGRRCRFVGPLGMKRKRRFLTAARCVVIPSLAAETSSLVAMEALACGTPVVAFARGALPQIIDHGRTGYLVESVEGMAEAIAAAGSLDPLTCRGEARRRFSVRRMTERYLALYEALARGDWRRFARVG
ncbi:MAG: glycosyltransferase family 4 protein [Methylobacteriaceae bacterium]|nr:glycosyltransferase family 4 protein [Methylobacteriaceae bacterium]MBV9633044.1 glycosyltransferase family 4 protein [Methylobacteriaceae bacterium]MBV9702017.1 glycosyltransferase family 4 protein [Methylobacteriaceae bacterium]